MIFIYEVKSNIKAAKMDNIFNKIDVNNSSNLSVEFPTCSRQRPRHYNEETFWTIQYIQLHTYYNGNVCRLTSAKHFGQCN